jgi:hypothetical protein
MVALSRALKGWGKIMRVFFDLEMSVVSVFLLI